ncbi:hypothetical protein LA080_008950 [Diaporthe eres]|nr:hypothetical protein LA080_008950 [Diaporthe eres]
MDRSDDEPLLEPPPRKCAADVSLTSPAPRIAPLKTQREEPPDLTASPQVPSQDSSSPALTMAAPGSTQAITHIVLFKYKPSISWEAFEEHFETFKALQH